MGIQQKSLFPSMSLPNFPYYVLEGEPNHHVCDEVYIKSWKNFVGSDGNNIRIQSYPNKWHMMTYNGQINVIGLRNAQPVGGWMSVGWEENILLKAFSTSDLVNARRPDPKGWEKFTISKRHNGKFTLFSHQNNRYLNQFTNGEIHANDTRIHKRNEFEIKCWGKCENKLVH
jgi:hypothetical protein